MNPNNKKQTAQENEREMGNRPRTGGRCGLPAAPVRLTTAGGTPTTRETEGADVIGKREWERECESGASSKQYWETLAGAVRLVFNSVATDSHLGPHCWAGAQLGQARP